MSVRDTTPCGAKTRSGGTCKNPAMANGRCRLHGGATPSGIASPHFVHGRRGNSIPARLAADYATGLADEDLLNIRDDVALIDARINELIGRIEDGDPGKGWLELKKEYDEFVVCYRSGDTKGGAKAMAVIGLLIEQGATDYALWEQIISALDKRRRLVDTERKRVTAMQQMITTEQAMNLIGSLVGIIRTHIHDRPTLAAIQADVNRLIGQPTGRGDRTQ